VSSDGSGEAILALTDTGAVTEIPVPSGRKRRQDGTSGRRRVSGRQTNSARVRERTTNGGTDAPRKARKTQKPPGVLGPCPLCGSDIIEQERSYGCSGWRNGCKFSIWKTIAGKKIGAGTALALLKQGRSPVLKGFASRSGKPFEARLKLVGGEIRFDFGT
jgi:DNA topoisomerase-3